MNKSKKNKQETLNVEQLLDRAQIKKSALIKIVDKLKAEQTKHSKKG
ncbi:hypothetical protein [Formosa haliotis]|nr:hypothetical protein [Formosa haliotis]